MTEEAGGRPVACLLTHKFWHSSTMECERADVDKLEMLARLREANMMAATAKQMMISEGEMKRKLKWNFGTM